MEVEVLLISKMFTCEIWLFSRCGTGRWERSKLSGDNYFNRGVEGTEIREFKGIRENQGITGNHLRMREKRKRFSSVRKSLSSAMRDS